MTKIDKLIARLLTLPRDFTFDEVCKVLSYLGFTMSNKGKTSGSRVEFVKDTDTILIHNPHPSGQMKHYMVKQLVETLQEKNYL